MKPNARVVVRPATTEDAEMICEFGKVILPEVYLSLTSADYVQALLDQYWVSDAFIQSISSSTNCSMVALSEDKLVGFSETQWKGSQANLWKLYVLSAFRGQGLGARLIGETIKRLPDEIDTLYTEYLTSNAPAGGFYAAQGFVFDHLEHDEDHPGFSYTWLRKKLSDNPK
jgi:ribosomal protein S18 acetylase RimI-like enzyme